jgi:hypothetical protein
MHNFRNPGPLSQSRDALQVGDHTVSGPATVCLFVLLTSPVLYFISVILENLSDPTRRGSLLLDTMAQQLPHSSPLRYSPWRLPTLPNRSDYISIYLSI